MLKLTFKSILLACISAFFLAVGLGCDESTPTGPGDPTELEGTWKGTIQDETTPEWTWIMTGSSFSSTTSDNSENYSGTFSNNTSTNPKQLDANITACNDPDYVGKTSLSIYKIDGSTLTLSAAEPGTGVRPADFQDQNGQIWILIKQ